MLYSEPAFGNRQMVKMKYMGSKSVMVQVATKAVRDAPVYQQYWVISKNVCTAPGLLLFRDPGFSMSVLESREKGYTGEITNYNAWNTMYYRNHKDEASKHRSITFGFTVDKVNPDTTANTKRDQYMAHLRFEQGFGDITMDQLWACIQGAKPVSILPSPGVSMDCDYSECIGEFVTVGW